jgi:hypothetical protein
VNLIVVGIDPTIVLIASGVEYDLAVQLSVLEEDPL